MTFQKTFQWDFKCKRPPVTVLTAKFRGGLGPGTDQLGKLLFKTLTQDVLRFKFMLIFS